MMQTMVAADLAKVKKGNTMNYTERLRKELERVTLRGNADKETVRVMAAIIFDLEQRLNKLEVPTEEEVPFVEVELEEPETKTTRRVSSKNEEK